MIKVVNEEDGIKLGEWSDIVSVNTYD